MKKILGATALSIALGASALGGAPAQAASPASSPSGSGQGDTSLAEVLGADGAKFDKSLKDFDITYAAVLAVLDAKPDSPVGLLADGDVRLTAFVPTDKAFQILVKDLTGKKLTSEKKIFKAVAGLGIDTVEEVLLYHVVPGKTLASPKVLKADGADLATALPDATVRVKVKTKGKKTKVVLRDNDNNSRDPRVKILDINRGNKQVAHGINRVLRPLDL